MSAAPLLRGPRGLAARAPGLLGPELALAVVADGLFWDRGVGLSLPLFCAAVAATAMRLRPGMRRGWRLPATLLLAGALAPACFRPMPLSFAFAIVGTVMALRLDAAPVGTGWPCLLLAAARDLASGPRRALVDLARRRRLAARRRDVGAGRLARLIAWTAPVLFLALFTALLASANPLIADAITGLPLPSPGDLLACLPRALFGLAVLVKLWPLVRSRRQLRASRPLRPAPPHPSARALDRTAALLLTPAAVLRTLVLLDLLLALQLGLDGAYLWGGLALPGGMSYAAYAHRGAYPLIATACIAGGLALAIRRPGAQPLPGVAAPLLLLFLGENLLLVALATERLALYVGAYALTEWRVAAFAWMGLVGFGLVSITVEGARRGGVRALLRANALAALALLYGWCFLDVPRLVADYDVAHCAELGGRGPVLDLDALGALGPEALPVLDRYLSGGGPDRDRAAASRCRDRWAREVRAGMADWRSWSLAGWRLARYLDTSGVAEPATMPAGDDGS